MMLIKILEFGSSWWARFGRDSHDRHRYTRHAAYFNSTGVRCGNKMRRYWVVPGLIRFSGVGDFNPHFPSRSIGEVFECSDLVFARGGNRVLFRRRVAKSCRPDYFLLVASSGRFGSLRFEGSDRSGSPIPIAVSHLGEEQEAMLLMKAGDRVRSGLGIWQLMVAPNLRHGASLLLLEDEILD
jgi:hypothetical protein